MRKELFIKYLQGSCTEEEFNQFLSWIKEDSQLNSGKEFIQEIWDNFEVEAAPEERMKYSRILDKIHHQINITNATEHLGKPIVSAKSRMMTIFTRVAAILLLPTLILLGYTNLSKNNHIASNENILEVEAPGGSRIHMKLPDGTTVYLNHGSKLSYPYRFEGGIRKVFLVGEAYFQVAHNAKVPFIVGTNHLDVKATGTAFNVSAYPDDNTVETTLDEGKIILYEKINNKEIKALTPGECLKFDKHSDSFSIENSNTLKYTAWKDGMLVFKNDNVDDIAKKLSRWYNIEVEITNQKIREYPFTATFTGETLSQVLELLSLATPVSYQLTARKKLPDGSFSKEKVIIGLKNEIKR